MEAVRTCIACRSRSPRSELVRIISDNSVVIIDRNASAHGRGAWLHPTVQCFQNASRKGVCERALKVRGHLDVTHMTEQAKRLMDHS